MKQHLRRSPEWATCVDKISVNSSTLGNSDKGQANKQEHAKINGCDKNKKFELDHRSPGGNFCREKQTAATERM